MLSQKRKALLLKPHVFFCITAALFGLLFLLITPPFQAPDEEAHFYRAYQVSELNFVSDTNQKGEVGGELPDELQRVAHITTSNPTLQFNPGKKYSAGKTLLALREKHTNREEFYAFPATAGYSPISYLPQSIAMSLTRLVRAPALITFYAGRFSNLIAWIAMLALAIWLLPRRKWALVCVGLLPMALFQAASLSPDSLTIASFFVFMALIFNLREKAQVKNVDILWLGLLAMTMVLCKQIMVVLLPLVLLLPSKKFSSKRTAWLIKALLIVVPTFFAGLWMAFGAVTDPHAVVANGQNPSAQIAFMLHNPHSFINTLFNTYFYTWGDSITRSVIGTFGWVDAPLALVWVMVGYGLLAYAFMVGSEGASKLPLLSKKEKLFVGLIAAAYFGAVSAALYAYYSPVGYKIIVGIQGRYLIPCLALLIPVLYPTALKVPSAAYRRVVTLGPAFLLVVSIITLYVRYYINNV